MNLTTTKLAAAAALSLAAVLPAQAHLTIFQGTFAPEASGATGTGSLYMEYDDEGHTLAINASWSGLSGLTTNAHIHCCTALPNTGTAGVALATAGILPDFPLGVSSGSYVKVIDMSQVSSYSAAYLAASGGTALGAETRLVNNLTSGNAYFNIHSRTFGGGEIRAFVTVVPEPGTWAMMALGLVATGGWLRRRPAA
jgi:CHRD domain/PEP-CTERM motif